MTEEEWLACEDPKKLAEEVYTWYVCVRCRQKVSRYPANSACTQCNARRKTTPRFSTRKYRLIGCACCRLIWDDLASDEQRRAVETAERYAEGEADTEQLRRAWQQSAPPGCTTASQYEHEPLLGAVAQVVARTAEVRRRQWASASGPARDEIARRAAEDPRRLCDAIRDVAGNPFRPVSIDPHWLDANGGQVRAVARGIAEEGRFADLPVLADALEDAGCSDEQVLSHARQPAHYRGCWLLDAIVGKS
jgi:hypothetical protein